MAKEEEIDPVPRPQAAKLRVLVCDDEPLAVEYLGKILAGRGDAEVVTAAQDGFAAVEAVVRLEPDLILLDIEMPVCDGFDVVQQIARLDLDRPPLIAFVTAYRRFAPQAFETGAIDFLTKPVRSERLDLTIARAREAVLDRNARRRLAEIEEMLPAYREGLGAAASGHVWVTTRGETIRVEFESIERIEAEGPYSRLYVGGASFLYRDGISEMVQRLPPDLFMRVHRSHVVRLDGVRAVRRTLHGAPQLLLADGSRIPVGRKFAAAVRRLIASH